MRFLGLDELLCLRLDLLVKPLVDVLEPCPLIENQRELLLKRVKPLLKVALLFQQLPDPCVRQPQLVYQILFYLPRRTLTLLS
jgi:hypothetical protein